MDDKAVIKTVVMPTGFREVDRLIGGFRPGELVVIGGRPAMGKTSLALSILRNAHRSHSGCYLSLRTPVVEIQRIMAGITEEVEPAIKMVSLDPDPIDLLPPVRENSQWLVQVRLPGLLHLLETMTALVRIHPPDYFVVDSLQDLGEGIRPMFSNDKNYEEPLRHLKVFARTAGVPVVVISELHQKADLVEKRNRGIPFYASRERIPDVLLVPVRYAYYGMEEDEDGEPVTEDQARLWVSVNRREQRQVFASDLRFGRLTGGFSDGGFAT